MATPRPRQFLLKLQVVHSPRWMQWVRAYINWVGLGMLGVVATLITLAAVSQPNLIYWVYAIIAVAIVGGAVWRVIDMRVRGYLYLTATDAFLKEAQQKPVRIPLQPPLLIQLYVVPPSSVPMPRVSRPIFLSMSPQTGGAEVYSPEMSRMIFEVHGKQHVLPVRLWKQDFDRLKHILKLWYQNRVPFQEYVQDDKGEWQTSRFFRLEKDK